MIDLNLTSWREGNEVMIEIGPNLAPQWGAPATATAWRSGT